MFVKFCIWRNSTILISMQCILWPSLDGNFYLVLIFRWACINTSKVRHFHISSLEDWAYETQCYESLPCFISLYRWNIRAYIYIYIYIYIYQPLRTSRMRYKDNLKQNLTGLNSEFSFYIHYNTKVKECSLPYYLLIAERRAVRFIPFPRVLALSEMQTASPGIWNRSLCKFIYVYIYKG